MKRNWFLPVIVIIALLLLSSPVYAAAPVEKYKPVQATDVQIVKKVTLKGPAAKGGKISSLAATGILGDPGMGKKYAIVIGIKDYPGDSADLQYTVADANLMNDVLSNIYGFKNVVEITDSAATTTNIYNTINDLKARVKSGDEVVFYFSGHGAKGKVDDGDNNMDQAIVTWPGAGDTGTFGFIWDGQLKDWFSGFKATRIIFIFDSCLSGGMSVLTDYNDGRLVCMGSTINSMSLEGSQWGGGHGQFTYYLAEAGMQEGNAGIYDYNKDGVLYQPVDVSVEEAYDYAAANSKSQTPTVADGFTNDLLP